MGVLLGLVAIAATVVALLIGGRPFITKLRRSRHKPRSGVLRMISDSDDANIIAVHGLGADPEHTWNGTVSADGTEPKPDGQRSRKTHLLRDLLKPDFPEARIWNFAYNSNWLTDAPNITTAEIGKSLLGQVEKHLLVNMTEQRKKSGLPIIFIAHSMGGIAVQQALCRDDAEEITNLTCGIIFLGTPHQGSSVSMMGSVLALATGFLGSSATLLWSLEAHSHDLTKLQRDFKNKKRSSDGKILNFPTMAFYETKPTYILGLSVGLIVSQDSATVDAEYTYAIASDHSGLNKCSGPEDELYQQLKDSIKNIRAPSQLAIADDVIRDEHYSKDILRIERLSGDLLPMDQCYINLAIVEQVNQRENDTKTERGQSSQFSLLARQKVDVGAQSHAVQLSKVFDPRKGRNGQMQSPRRIFIRGRAGVGKTTLCKKIIYDFVHDTQSKLHRSWSELFDRVLWIPLRNLKEDISAGYNDNTFYKEYFAIKGRNVGLRLAAELWQDLERTNCERTLFILDGLDEVSQNLGGDCRFLSRLLNRPNVIITSRPSTELPSDIRTPDLELETIGFYPQQVDSYLQADPHMMTELSNVQRFLKERWLLKNLVRLPILLDALCFTWEDFGNGAVPDSMTVLYRAIERRLWKKDAVRLEMISKGDARGLYPSQIELQVKTEIDLLGLLAFNGLHADVIEFTPEQRSKVVTSFTALTGSTITDTTLAKLSFLRTSNPSSKATSRPDYKSYHFIHLTFQEYFAARYFVQEWKSGGELQYILGEPGHGQSALFTDPVRFLQAHKYSPRYDVFWRFVAGISSHNGLAIEFMDKIEEEPLDLLGPMHQRLVMRCLSEVHDGFPDKRRQELEKVLSEWVVFECRLTERSRLVYEAEFPENALLDALSRGYDVRLKILESLEHRLTIPPNVLKLLTHYLETPDPDPNTQERAVKVLGHRQELPTSVLEAFAALLNGWFHPHTASRLALQNYSSQLPESVLMMIGDWLDDPDKFTRKTAIRALQCRSELPETIIAALSRQLADSDEDVRSEAAEALCSQPDLPVTTLSAIVALLESPEENTRQGVVRALSTIPQLPEMILLDLIALISNPNSGAEMRAAEVISSQLELPDAGLIRLTEQLTDPCSYVRMAASRALASPLELPEQVLEILAARLVDPDAHVQFTASYALERRAELPEPILMVVARRLNHPDKRVRGSAASVLEHQSRLSEGILSTIFMKLKDQDSGVRQAAVDSLSGRSMLPGTIVAAIIDCFDDPDDDVRSAAMNALKSEELPERAIATLIARLEDPSDLVQSNAAEALGNQKGLPENAILALIARLDDQDFMLGKAAAAAISGLPEIPDTIARALADSPHFGPEKAIALGLGRQSKLPWIILATLATRLEDPDDSVRRDAVYLLRCQSELPETLLHALVMRLEDTDIFVQRTVAETHRDHGELCYSLLKGPHVANLYKASLEASFNEQLSWYSFENYFFSSEPSWRVYSPTEDDIEGRIKRLRLAGQPPTVLSNGGEEGA